MLVDNFESGPRGMELLQQQPPITFERGGSIVEARGLQAMSIGRFGSERFSVIHEIERRPEGAIARTILLHHQGGPFREVGPRQVVIEDDAIVHTRGFGIGLNASEERQIADRLISGFDDAQEYTEAEGLINLRRDNTEIVLRDLYPSASEEALVASHENQRTSFGIYGD